MSENVTRSISGIIFITLLVFATLFSEISFIALFSAFAFIAVFEFCSLIKLDAKIPYLLVVIAIALGVVLDTHSPTNNIVLVAATLFVSINLMINLFKTSKNELFSSDLAGKYIQLLGYVIFPFVIIMKLPYIQGSFTPQIVIGIFVLIWTNDTFAYIFGKYLGKNKLFERVSPKKTIEGFIGGMAVCLIVAYILSIYFTFLTPIQWLVLGLIMSVIGTIGDLVESKYKRIAGVKDSGKIMPGHGGILDRLDSVIFAVPFIYFVLFFIS
nr:phosphatidate cytidylyltransferase [uncultured Flavobacterium sp.]